MGQSPCERIREPSAPAAEPLSVTETKSQRTSQATRPATVTRVSDIRVLVPPRPARGRTNLRRTRRKRRGRQPGRRGGEGGASREGYITRVRSKPSTPRLTPYNREPASSAALPSEESAHEVPSRSVSRAAPWLQHCRPDHVHRAGGMMASWGRDRAATCPRSSPVAR